MTKSKSINQSKGVKDHGQLKQWADPMMRLNDARRSSWDEEVDGKIFFDDHQQVWILNLKQQVCERERERERGMLTDGWKGLEIEEFVVSAYHITQSLQRLHHELKWVSNEMMRVDEVIWSRAKKRGEEDEGIYWN